MMKFIRIRLDKSTRRTGINSVPKHQGLPKAKTDKTLTQSELHSFIVWLDSGIAPFFGDYKNIDAQLRGEQVEPSLD